MGEDRGAMRGTWARSVLLATRIVLLSAVASASAAGCLLALAPNAVAAPPPSGPQPSVTFTASGCSLQTIPSGYNTVAIQATGASGSTGNESNTYQPGLGSTVSGTLAGVSGQLDVCVNVGGGSGGPTSQGSVGGAGGGASGVSLGSDFSQLVLIAGVADHSGLRLEQPVWRRGRRGGRCVRGDLQQRRHRVPGGRQRPADAGGRRLSRVVGR